MENKTEVEKFFEELPSENKQERNVFDEKNKENLIEKEPVPEETLEKEEDKPRKNRRERRLEEQLQRERESNIALNERIRVLAEVERLGDKSSPDVPAEWTQLMGDSPEALKAWKLQQQLLQSATERAKMEALQEFQEREERSQEEQREYEQQIDSELEYLEEEHNVDLTSNSPAARKARREFLELIQDVSPKDENGNIVGYADFERTFELYQKTRSQDKPNPTTQKQKEMASKTMQQSAGLSANDEPQGPMNWEKAKAAINRFIS